MEKDLLLHNSKPDHLINQVQKKVSEKKKKKKKTKIHLFHLFLKFGVNKITFIRIYVFRIIHKP